MPITINEIAKKAGVGVGTVSRYINKQPHVSKKSGEKIKAVIDEFDFVPSALAAQLRSHSTKNIGLLVSRVANPFFSVLFDKLETKLKEQGYQLLVSQTHDDPASEKRFLEQLKTQKVDAVILASVENPSLVMQAIKEHKNKIILLNEHIAGTNSPSIELNHYQATYDALDYLYIQGRRRIAYATGGEYPSVRHGKTRTKAYQDFCTQYNLVINPQIIYTDQHTINDGLEIGKKISIMPQEMRPDSVFANSDEVAIGLIHELKQSGIAVPEEIAVIGYDDQPMAPFVEVPLTTLQQPVDEMVNETVDLLLKCLHGDEINAQKKKLDLKLIVRASA